ncbi:MAG: RND transporter, partial [Verrucomicrobia bacterium]|nr:RND transporter [Verrucomicrobiota bacterium]
TANLRFILESETNALLVSNAALRWNPSSLAEVVPDARHGDAADPPPVQKGAAGQFDSRMVWVKDGAFARPVAVATGISDGVNTVVKSGLRAGQEAVIGEEIGTGNQAAVQNPFLPKRR